MKVLQSGVFSRTVKKLHKKEKTALDRAVKKVMDDPTVGALKVGDLAGVRVYKFKVVAQQYLLGYQYRDEDATLMLLALGSHENFYRDLKA
ncbi:MAG: type II toxin-antitoxin system RelE/ParE family toxin [Gammaproteobacteria bacterium]